MSDFLFQEIYIIPELEWSLHSSTVLFLLVYFTRKRICNCIHPCEHFQRHMKAANMQLWASWGVHIYHVCWHQYNVARNWFQMEMFCHSHTLVLFHYVSRSTVFLLLHKSLQRKNIHSSWREEDLCKATWGLENRLYELFWTKCLITAL